jgi:hypothetical protein
MVTHRISYGPQADMRGGDGTARFVCQPPGPSFMM